MSYQQNAESPAQASVPSDSWLDTYMEYTLDQESPDAFHLWTATTVLAAAMGRKCYINKGYYKLYPNLFVVLVAGAAKLRKSTAINLGIITPDEIELFEHVPNTLIINGKITPEKFIQELSDAKTPDPNSNG